MAISSVSGSVTVGASSTAFLPANNTRVKLHIINNSDSDIALAFGGDTAVLTKGTILKASGGAYFDENTIKNQGAGIMEEITAIADGAGKVVSYTEWLTN